MNRPPNLTTPPNFTVLKSSSVEDNEILCDPHLAYGLPCGSINVKSGTGDCDSIFFRGWAHTWRSRILLKIQNNTLESWVFVVFLVRSILYLNFKEELCLHYFTHISHCSYIKTILTHKAFVLFCSEGHRIFHIAEYHIFPLTSYVFVVSKKSVSYGNHFELKTYE